jgi:hypothetical protein
LKITTGTNQTQATQILEAKGVESTNSKTSLENWYKLVCKSLTDDKVISPFGDLLPRFPSEELQRNTTSLSGEQALSQANGFYGDINVALESHGIRIEPDWVIVDFGSCWGRISRFFMRDVPKKNIYGLDVEKGFVDICNTLFDSDTFSICNAMPPCGFNDSSVNLISAYSVFSHLSENAFLAWLREFGRMLKPGGIVTFTTRNEGFLDYCASLHSRKDELSGYQLGGDARLRQRYLAGEFVFVSGRGVSGGGAMNESFYGESFIPKTYVEHNFDGLFQVMDHKPSGNGYDQALFVLRKKSR